MGDNSKAKCPENSLKSRIKRSRRQISEKLKLSNPTKDDDEYAKECKTFNELVKFKKRIKAICSEMMVDKQNYEKNLNLLFDKYRESLSDNRIASCFPFLKTEFSRVQEVKTDLLHNLDVNVITPVTEIETNKQVTVTKNMKNTIAFRLDYDDVKNSKKSKEIIDYAKDELNKSRDATYQSLVAYNTNTLLYMTVLYEFAKAMEEYHENAHRVYANILACLENDIESLALEKASPVESRESTFSMNASVSATASTSEQNSFSDSDECTKTKEASNPVLPEASPHQPAANGDESSNKENEGRTMVVLSTFSTPSSHYLDVEAGEHVQFVQQGETWFIVRNKEGQQGIVPFDYLEFLD